MVVLGGDAVKSILIKWVKHGVGWWGGGGLGGGGGGARGWNSVSP